MPIAPLPDSTARAIGSTSVVTDAWSVVKELLDNALDAASTSVSVEIAQNTVDIIQVKDNGHGIDAADVEFVCKRAHTSKIQTLEDLRTLGGRSLGFRGVALASVAEMSELVSVTTRTQAEPVASLLKYNRQGDLLSREKTSHPVGTTVCVIGFLKHVPVRKQAASKTASKTISRIKRLLQAYAIAQPATRLSLKVLRAKNDSANWIYAPTQNATIADAALKIWGPEIKTQCAVFDWPEAETTKEEGTSFKLIASLPRSDSDFSKLSNPGQFISVDGRPLSTARGTSKEIVRLYKSYIRSCARQRGLDVSLTDPILCLHILCPVGAYDVNIEPAKDDVLFADANAVTALAESLFRKVYGDLRSSDEGSGEALTSTETNSVVREPDTPPPTNPGSAVGRFRPVEASEVQIPMATPPSSLPGRVVGEGGRLSDGLSTNPWTIARTRVFSRSENQRSASAAQQVVGSISNVRNRAHAAVQLGSDSRTSPPEDVLPVFTERNRGSRLTFTSPIPSRGRERHGDRTLDAWLHSYERDQGSSFSSLDEREESVLSDGAESGMLLDRTEEDDVMQSDDHTMPSSLSNNAEMQSPQLGSPGVGNKRQRLPMLEESDRVNRTWDKTAFTPEVEMALDFERRKRAAILSRREQMRKMKDLVVPNTPHRNRFLAARAALEDAGVPKTQTATKTKTSLKPSDPRALFMREPNAPSSRLPLERTPQEYTIYNVALVWPASLDRISVLHKALVKREAGADPAPRSAFTSADLEPACKEWEDTLRRLLRERYAVENETVKDLYTAVSKAISSNLCDI